MKKFTIEVSHAAPGQLATIAAELKIMSNGWTKYGPGSESMATSFKLQAFEYLDQAASMDREAASHKLATIKGYKILC